MINRKFKKDLKRIVNNYYKNEYKASTDCFDLLKEKFSDEDWFFMILRGFEYFDAK